MKHHEKYIRKTKYRLKFTPLEFETDLARKNFPCHIQLKFTPLEFETGHIFGIRRKNEKSLKFTPLEFETFVLLCVGVVYTKIKIYSVGV